MKIIFTSIAISLIVLSCQGKKEENESMPAPLSASERAMIQDENSAENEFDELASIDVEALAESGMSMRMENTIPRDTLIRTSDSTQSLWCATVTRDRNHRRITVDFGSGCLGRDGRLRKGKIYIDYANPQGQGFVSFYSTVGNRIITSYDDYEVDDIKVEGQRTSTYVGDNTVEIVVSEASLTYPNGKKIFWSSNRRRKQLTGIDTKRWNDDKFNINGSSEGVSRDGIRFKSTVRDIIIDLTCPVGFRRFPTSGIRTVEFGENYQNSRTIDFGNGDCDLRITIRGVRQNNIEIFLGQ